MNAYRSVALTIILAGILIPTGVRAMHRHAASQAAHRANDAKYLEVLHANEKLLIVTLDTQRNEAERQKTIQALAHVRNEETDLQRKLSQ